MPKAPPTPSRQRVTLDDIEYRIERCPAGEVDSDDDACDALIDFPTLTIKVREDAKEQSFWLIVGHEIGHNWLEWAGLGQILEKDHQEAVCDAVGAGLVRLLRQNPGFQEQVRKAFD